MMVHKDKISNRIKEAMHIRQLRQTDLVEMTGLSKSAISQYLSDRNLPKQKAIFLLSQALGVQEAWLMGYDVPMEPKPVPPAGAEAAAGAGPAGAPAQLTPDAAQLVSKYNQLDTLDKGKTHGYVDNLLTDEKYKKEDLTTAG